MKRKKVTVSFVSSGLNAGQFAVKVNGKTVQLRHDKGTAQRVATTYRKSAHRDALAKRLRKMRAKRKG